MGRVDPAELSNSGEVCLRRLLELQNAGLPPAPLITAIGTVVEVHVSRVLSALVASVGVDETPFGRALLESAEPLSTSWDARARWLKEGFSINYTGDKPYQDFAVLVDLRNAIVHGDGALSDLQAGANVKEFTIMTRDFESKLAVAFNERAQYGDATAAKAIEIARTFVLDFDRRVLNRYPDLRRL